MSRPKKLDISCTGLLPPTDISLEYRIIVDDLASEFEKQWPSTSRQSIESILERATTLGLEPYCINELFRELFLIELELLDRAGDTLRPRDYLRRFPERSSDIEEIYPQYKPLQSGQRKSAPIETTDFSPFSARYIQEALIARGGMGIVYRGFDRVLQRPVAIKVLDPDLLDDEEALKRFRREPITCGNLQHPNVVPVYDSGTTEDGRPFFAMKLIGGHTLAELIDTFQVEIGSEAVLEIFQQVCHAIASAHRQGVIHRDIKPSNIMVADLGEVYVMDWGLSGILNSNNVTSEASAGAKTEASANLSTLARPLSDSDYSTLTTGGAIFGTPRYMPPEFRSESADRSNKRVDVYCLGAVLCELLVGKTPRQIMDSSRSVTDASDLLNYLTSRHVDRELASIAVACVHPDPSKRPESADDLVQKLEIYRKNVRNRIRQAELNAQSLRHRNRIVKLRFRVSATILSSLLVIIIFAAWSFSRAQFAKSQQVATASRTLASAMVAFNIACESATWSDPQWDYAEQLLKVAIPEVQQSKDKKLKAELVTLQNYSLLMNGIRDAVTLKTDLKNNVFYYDDKESKIIDAFAAIDVDTEKEISHVVDKVLSLPDGAKHLVLGVLTELVGSDRPLSHRDYWNKLTPILEERITGTNLAASLISNDINELKKCVEPSNLDKYMPIALDILGHAFRSMGEPKLCEQVLRFACNKYPSDFDVNTSLGNFLSSEFPDEPSKAMPFLAIASAIDPKPGALLNYASCLRDCGEFELADRVLEKLLKENPDYYYASVLWANCKTLQGDNDTAIKILEESIRRGSQNERTFLDLTELYRRQGDIATADNTLAVARELVWDHGDLDSLKHLLDLQHKLGHFASALRDAVEMTKINPDAHIYFEAAWAASNVYEFEQAIEFYKKDLEQHPDNAMAIVNIGFCLRELGRFDEARPYYLEGHQLGSSSPRWPFPTMDWIHELNECTEQLNDLDNVLERLHEPETPHQEIESILYKVLIPSRKWPAAYRLLLKLEDEGRFRSPDIDFTTMAAEVALQAALASSEAAEPNSVPDDSSSNESALTMQQKAAGWLALAAQGIEDSATDSKVRTRELHFLRMFLQSKRSAQFRDPKILSRLDAEVQESIATALQALTTGEQKLLAHRNN